MNAKTARQWMVTHEWMVKPMAQTEWIDGKGLMVWLAEVFSALGGGLFLVGVIFSSWWGIFFGWLMIVLFKFPLHLFYLGKPLRFWRAFPPFSKAWKTSWFARGVVFTTIFVGFGFIQLLVGALAPESFGDIAALTGGMSALYWVIAVIAGVFIILTSVYCGFAMSFCKSVPFWNTGMLPLVFLVLGFADGLALQAAVYLTQGREGFEDTIHTLELWTWGILILNTLLIAIYLMNAGYQSKIAQHSVRELIRGKVAVVFWVGIVLLGILVPFVIALVGVFVTAVTVPLWLSAIAVVCHTIGAFSLKYGVLKVGYYHPILPKSQKY
jgi:formate-dependent nitrite reductase membrane component NrfD